MDNTVAPTIYVPTAKLGDKIRILIPLLYASHTAPGRVIGLQVMYPVVVWQAPTEPNGVILDYQLTFIRGGESRTQSTTLIYYAIDVLRDIPGFSGTFSVEVKQT